jgi:hypothetical protein
MFQWWYCRQNGGLVPRLQPGPLLAEGVVPASPALGMDSDLPEITLADMNPDDIRVRIYLCVWNFLHRILLSLISYYQKLYTILVIIIYELK